MSDTFIPKKEKSKFYNDFKSRYNTYSKLGWKNKANVNTSKVDSQVPAFAIRLVSDNSMSGIKSKFPGIYNEISKISLIFQYIKYKPKKAANIWARNYLETEKNKFNYWKKGQQYKGIKVYAKSPTRESLGITRKLEEFKANYPKIIYRKLDGTLDIIKSDWSGYLVAMVRKPMQDGQVVGHDYFFNEPATIKHSHKVEVDERVFKKVSKVLNEIEAMITFLEFGGDEMYEVYKAKVITLANSLTVEGLDSKIEEKKLLEQEKQLKKKMIVAGGEDLEFDSAGFEDDLWVEEKKQSGISKEESWDELESKKEDKKQEEKKEEIDWDSFQ